MHVDLERILMRYHLQNSCMHAINLALQQFMSGGVYSQHAAQLTPRSLTPTPRRRNALFRFGQYSKEKLAQQPLLSTYIDCVYEGNWLRGKMEGR